MKKILFNDRYGLTEAVLSGRKTQTRRLVPDVLFCGNVDYKENPPMFEDCNGDWHTILESKYAFQIGEIVAIAQSYASIVDELEDPKNFCCMEHWESASGDRAHYCGYLEHPGFTNKMFVSADEMPHQIRITNVRVERLQDISDEDVIREGFSRVSVNENMGNCLSHWEYQLLYEDKLGRPLYLSDKSAPEAYSRLIDKISGNGTWEKNPYVFVYDFELVK